LTKNTDTYKYNDYAVTDRDLLYEDVPAHTMKACWGNGDPAPLIHNIQNSFAAPAKSPVPTQEARRALEPVCEKNLTPFGNQPCFCCVLFCSIVMIYKIH